MSRTARLSVSLSKVVPANKTISINYQTSDGTAVSPTDYASASGTLVFTQGQQTKNIDFVIRNLGQGLESDLFFNVTFSNPVGSSGTSVSLLGSSVRQVTVPGNVNYGTEEYLERFKWMWDKIFDRDSGYIPQTYFNEKLEYLAPHYLSSKDSLIIVEDRLPNNSIDNGLQYSSETMAFLTGLRYWRDIVIRDRTQLESKSTYGCDYAYYVREDNLPVVNNQGNDNIPLDYSYAAVFYQGTSLQDYPLTPQSGTDLFGDYPYRPDIFHIIPCTPFLKTKQQDPAIPDSTFVDHGYSKVRFFYYPYLPHYIYYIELFKDIKTSAVNNNVCTDTRGRYESVYQTLVPYAQDEGSVVGYNQPKLLGTTYLRTEVHPDIDISKFDFDTEFRRQVLRNNPYADQMLLHWEHVASQEIVVTDNDTAYQSINSKVNPVYFVNGLYYNLCDKYFRQVGNGQQIWTDDLTDSSPLLNLINISYQIEYIEQPGLSRKALFECHSECHHAFQNLMASNYISGNSSVDVSAIDPETQNAFLNTFARQLVLLRWLQSPEGPIAGGVTNSYQEKYAVPTDGRQNVKFCGMYYTYSPGKVNPPSNDRVDWQTLGHLSTADYFLHCSLAGINDIGSIVEKILDNLVVWFLNNTNIEPTQGLFSVPTKLKWTSTQPVVGQTTTSPNSEGVYEYLPSVEVTDANVNTYINDTNHVFWTGPNPSPNLHCTIVESGEDLGTAVSLCYLLIVYCKAKQELGKFNTQINSSGKDAEDVFNLAKSLMDKIWTFCRDNIGITNEETRTDYSKMYDNLILSTTDIYDTIYKTPIETSQGFIGLRPFLMSDPKYTEVYNYFDNGGDAPVFKYHRTWVQCLFGIANAAMYRYFYQNT